MPLVRIYARFVVLSCCLAACLASSPVGAADQGTALHEQIDALIDRRLAELKITPAGPADDAEFLRRVSLDLNGVIPTAAEARAFLDDRSPDKRRRLVERLLSSPDYPLHMARTFDVMLAERRIPTISSYDVAAKEWRTYLAEAFAENRPWDKLAAEILAGDGADKTRGSAVKFYLVRDVEPHQLTRDVGRLFLGVDLQCARCHDDPRIEEYRQSDYYGLYAFLERVKVHPMTGRGALVAEGRAEGKTKFTSVFTAKSGETNPRLPGDEMLSDPQLEKGKEYVVKPGAKEPSVPAYSRRKKLAERLPRAATSGFARNIANRLWAHMLGRGIVHPVDLHHAGNPASHAELLDRLAEWLVENRFDLKGLLREIALSDAYGRSSRLPSGAKEPPADAFAVAELRGLTAEQFRWSVLQATGRIELQMAQGGDKKKTAGAASSSAAAAGDWRAKAAACEPLEKRTAGLAAAFAGLPGQAEGAFQPIVDQALFLMNSPQMTALLGDEPGTSLARWTKIEQAEPLAEDLYLAVFARRPTAEETDEVGRLLRAAPQPAARRGAPSGSAATTPKNTALRGLVRGLLLSAEFRLNH